MTNYVEKDIYRLGDTIPMRFIGDSDTDLENNDFKVSILNPYGTAIEVNKEDCAKIQDNEYHYEIANTVSKNMKTGNYKLEIYLGTTNSLIFAEDNFFELKDSYSKKFAV